MSSALKDTLCWAAQQGCAEREEESQRPAEPLSAGPLHNLLCALLLGPCWPPKARRETLFSACVPVCLFLCLPGLPRATTRHHANRWNSLEFWGVLRTALLGAAGNLTALGLFLIPL